MKAFFSSFKKEEIKNKIRQVFSRFPLATLISIIVTVIFFILVATNLGSETEKLLARIIMSSIVVFFLSTGVTLYGETLKKQKYISIGHIASLIFGGLFFYFLSANIESFENIVFFILTLFGVISFLFFAPYVKYLKNPSHKEQSYYVYFYKISVVLFISCIVGGALAILGSIAILAVHTLFDLKYSISGDMYGYWISFSLAFLTPIFALSQIPTKEKFEESYFNENAFFNFMIRYIALPFIYIYFFILYAYILKVLLNFSAWPKGEVTWMVIGFSLFGYIIYIFSYIFECGKKQESHKLISLFRKYFPYVVLPPIAMLFYAISLRIGQYDITINRYFVVIFGAWLLTISLYLIISKKKSLLYIPALLTLLTLVISIGPWSVYHLPLTRQTARLEKNLIQAKILYDSDISPREIISLEKYEDIDPELSGEIYAGIDYVCGFDNCSKIKLLFPDIYADILKKDMQDYDDNTGNYQYYNDHSKDTYTGLGRWEIVSQLTETLKVKAYYPGRNNQESSIYYIHTDYSIYPLDISNHDYFIKIDSYSRDDSTINADINMKTQTLWVQTEDFSEEINISYVIKSLKESYIDIGNTSLSTEQSQFQIDSKLYSGILFIENASIARDKDIPLEIYQSENINAILLLKIK